jgi:hypothetical protein
VKITLHAAFAALLILGLALGCQAAVITFASDVSATETNLVDGTNEVVTPHAAWKTPTATRKWISYANTGIGAGSFSPANGTYTFKETFILPISSSFSGWLDVWADDTVEVILNGTNIKAGNYIPDNACASGPPSCEPTEGAHIILSGLPLVQGVNTLQFDLKQLWDGPSALMYEGEITATPEPGTMGMMILAGLGLVGLGKIHRKRQRQNSRI